MKERSEIKLIALLPLAVVLVLGMLSESIADDDNARQATPSKFAGTYSGALPLGGGLNFRALFTLHDDGTASSRDITDFGAPSVAGGDVPHLNTSAVGSWKKTGARSYVVTFIYYRSAVGGMGEIDAVGRISGTGTFDSNFNTGTLEAIVESFACAPATIGCPDPALLPGPVAPPLGTFTVLRIHPD